MQAEQEQRERQEPAGEGAPRLSGRIRLDGVGFRYAQTAPDVLREVDLTVEPGQRIAVVGASGSGKSTLGKLLLGLYLPTEGDICYDGLSLRQLDLQDLRRQFGVVLQESVLFSGSVLSNITLTDPALSRESVTEAAKLAGIHDDIVAMPMGYDTFVSEGGSALSGGQRQRIAIARAFLADPRILVMDDATSSVDASTEQAIKVAMREVMTGRTTFIIAHRLSTIALAEEIAVLEDGALAARGTHDELLEVSDLYREIAEKGLPDQVFLTRKPVEPTVVGL